jgi:hypothetical protein
VGFFNAGSRKAANDGLQRRRRRSKSADLPVGTALFGRCLDSPMVGI